MNTVSLPARTTALLFSALLSLPAQEVALSVQYSADGLQLTPAMVRGLINGPVRERLREAGDRNPDWPEVGTIVVTQSDADLRQPAGAFSCSLNLTPSAARNIGKALQVELELRLHGGPRQALQERHREFEAKLQELEAKLREAMEQREAHPLAAEVADVEDVARQLEEARLRLRVEQPMQAFGEEQATELRRKAENLREKLQAFAAEAAKLEAANANQEASLAKLNRLQLERESLQREHERVADQLAHAGDAIATRTTELMLTRQQVEALTDRLAQLQKMRAETQAIQRRVMNIEHHIDALTAERDAVRAKWQETKARLDAMVDVRVDVWG